MNAREAFIDSSAFYAFMSERDSAHHPVKTAIHELALPLVTSNFVFAETISLVTKRLDKTIAIALGDKILKSNFVRLVYLSETLQREAWQLFHDYRDKDFDYIDATSFVFCRKNSIQKVLTLDRHFTQMQFERLPNLD